MSISKLIEGAALAAGGVAVDFLVPGGQVAGQQMTNLGIGMMLSNIGSKTGPGAPQSHSTTERNPVAPRRVVMGRASTGGRLVYQHEWGGDTPTVDLIIVLNDRPSLSLDALLFDQQLVQVDGSVFDPSTATLLSGVRSGTSFTPVQQTVNIASIVRSNDVVTVSLNANIPYLAPGFNIKIQNVTGDLTLNGQFPVAQIISQVVGTPGSIVFTYLCGGLPVSITSQGQAVTAWADYGRTVYMEVLLGNQLLGETFNGMLNGTPFYGDNSGTLVSPASPHNAGGNPAPNPWTAYCSLQGMTAVMLRIYLNPKYYPSGLPMISFRMHGANDVYDPRLGACTGLSKDTHGTGLANPGSGYQYGDVMNVNQAGVGSDGQVTVTSVNSSGAILTYQVTKYGTGHSIGTGIPLAGGHGSGATLDIFALTGADGCNAYTENPALIIADYLVNLKYGFKYVYGSDIPLTALTASANICDQTVALASGGTEPMYALNGQFELSGPARGRILEDMLTSCAGRILPELPITIEPGYWTGAGSPPVQVDLQSIAAGPFRWEYISSRELFNAVKGTYVSPYNKWQPSDYPPYAQDALHGYSGPSQYGGDINLAADNGERRWFTLHLPYTISPSMAQRIAKIELLRRRWAGSRQYQGGSTVQIGGSGTFKLNMAGYQFQTLDVFEGTVASLSLSNQLLEVKDVRLLCEAKPGTSGDNMTAPLLGIEIDVQETDPSVYAWSTTEELTPQGYQQTQLPQGTFTELVPLPWSPGAQITAGSPPALTPMPLAGDAQIEGPGTFGIQPVYGQDAQGNATSSVQISGTPPINAIDTGIAAPEVTATAGTGGSLPAGQYVVAVAAYDSGASNHADSDYLDVAIVTVAANGSIAVTITWGSGDTGGDLYMCLWNANGYQMHYQQTISPGTTSVTITSFDQKTPGGPDTLFDHFVVERLTEEHGGIWAEQVQAVTATTITIASNTAGDVASNAYAGYTLSLLAKFDPTVVIPYLNMPVASNTASSGTPAEFVLTIGPGPDGNQLPDLTTLLAVGDLVEMRGKGTFTGSSWSEPAFANTYSPTGADPTKEPGRVAVVLTGADAGDVQTIASVTVDGFGNYTTWNLAGQWAITPSPGDIVVICDAAIVSTPSDAQLAQNSSAVTNFNISVPNLANVTYLFRVRTSDANGNMGPLALSPMRELYLFGSQKPRLVTVSGTEKNTDGVVKFDSSAGAITFQCLPAAQHPNVETFYVKISTDANPVTCNAATGEEFTDGTASFTLLNSGDSQTVKWHG